MKFRFKSDEPGSTFECKLKGDRVPTIQLTKWQTCRSPRKFKNLALGTYTVFVRATDLAGNTDGTPAKQRFQIVKRL